MFDCVKIHVLLQKNRGFEGFRGVEIDAKPMKNQYKIDTRQMYATIMEKYAKIEPKFESKSDENSKKAEKGGPKTNDKKWYGN